MLARKVSRADLVMFWKDKGVALCAEAQGDGVPCTVAGKACETCEHAVVAFLAAHPESEAGNYDRRTSTYPEGLQ